MGDVAAVKDPVTGLTDVRVFVGQRNTSFKDPILVFDTSGKFLYSFGADGVGKGVHHGAANWGVHGVNVHVRSESCDQVVEPFSVWVSDFLDHVMAVFSPEGNLLQRTGSAATSDADSFDSPAE